MKKYQEIFTSKSALIWHIIFFSFALLQKEFYLTILWFLMNCIITFLLINTVYKDNNNWELMSWYFYLLSFFTDFLCICSFGNDLSKGEESGTHKTAQRFVLAMAIFVMIPKPFFAIGIAKKLKSEGIDLKSGLKNPKKSLASLDYQGVTNPGEYVNNNNNNNDYMQNQNFQQPQYQNDEAPPYVQPNTQGIDMHVDNQQQNNEQPYPNLQGNIGQPIQQEYQNFNAPGSDNV